MRNETKLAIGLALMLATGGILRAQVNPNTVKNQAQAGVKQAQPPAQTPPASSKSTTPTKSTTTSTSTTPSKPPASQASNPPAKKSPATNAATNPSAPKSQDSKPPSPTAATKPPVTKPPVTTAQAPPKNVPPKTDKAKTPAASNATPQKTPPSKAAAKPAQKPVKPAPATKTASGPSRRDPFVTLIGKETGGATGPGIKLPPGIGGLQVSTLILQGIVSSPNGMIAMVANPQRSVYFLHVGDKLFDGSVEHIEIGAVTFHETGKDAFGKPLEREVVRRLNSSSGEQP